MFVVHPLTSNLLSLLYLCVGDVVYNHSPDHRYPAEDKHCNFCHGIGHFEYVCFKKQMQLKPTTSLLASGMAEPVLETGAVVSKTGGKTETVLVRV